MSIQSNAVSAIDIEETKEPVRVSIQGGRGSYTMNGEANQYDGLNRVTASSSTPVNPGASILQSARTPMGAIPTELNDDCIVTIGGMTATLGSAVQAGLVRKMNGQYFDLGEPQPGQQQQQKEQPQQEQQHQESPPQLDSGTAAKLEELYTQIGADEAGQVVDQIIFGNDLDASIDKMASHLGQDPGEFHGSVSNVIANFENMTANWMTKHCGVQGAEVIEWARYNLHPSSIKELSFHIYNGNMSAARVLAQDYKKAMGDAARMKDFEEAHGWE